MTTPMDCMMYSYIALDRLKLCQNVGETKYTKLIRDHLNMIKLPRKTFFVVLKNTMINNCMFRFPLTSRQTTFNLAWETYCTLKTL